MSGGLLAAATLSDQAALLRAIAVFCGIGFAILLVTRRPSGSRIDRDGWTVFCDGRTRHFARSDIRVVHLMTWPDGPDTVRIELRDGRFVTVPPTCLPDTDTLSAALDRLGVPLLRG